MGKTYEERNSHDLTKWLDYFVNGFLVEMEMVMDKIKPFLALKKVTTKKIILSKEELRILDFAQEMNHLTSSDVEDVLTVSKRTAQRYLSRLIKKGLIKKYGSKKMARYSIK